MTSPGKPRLVTVDAPPDEDASARAPQASPPRSGRLLRIGLGALAVVVAWALWVQTSRVTALEANVAGLEAELAGARGVIEAYEARMGEVRESVSGLQEQLSQLDALVATDPLAAPEATEAP